MELSESPAAPSDDTNICSGGPFHVFDSSAGAFPSPGLDSALPSSVQMAPCASQSSVAGSSTVTSAFESGVTLFSYREVSYELPGQDSILRGVCAIVHILGGRSVVPCRKGIHERTQAVRILPSGKARQSVNRRRFRFRPWSPRDAQRGLRRMRQSGNRTVPAPRRPARLLQRLLQPSGRRWSLLGQQTGTSAVPCLHYKCEARPQHTTLRACAFSSPWLC